MSEIDSQMTIIPERFKIYDLACVTCARTVHNSLLLFIPTIKRRLVEGERRKRRTAVVNQSADKSKVLTVINYTSFRYQIFREKASSVTRSTDGYVTIL